MSRSFVVCWYVALALALPASLSAQPAPAAQPVPAAQIEIEEEVEELAPPAQAPTAVPPAPDPDAARIEALEQRTQQLEAKLAQLQEPAASTAVRADQTKPPAAEAKQAADVAPEDESADPYGLRISGYLQSQYESSQFSEDEVQQGGALLNRDRFVLRRARLRVDGDSQYAAFALEVDANTVRGMTVAARRAYGVLRLPGPTPQDAPYVALTGGLQDIPFGFEVPEGSGNRIFMERSLASTAFFPGEPDIGATLSGGYGPLRYALSVMNGQPFDDRTGGISVVDPNAAKDLLAHVGAELREPDYELAGGVSVLSGRGFHAGAQASKNETGWVDLDEDAFVDDIEVTPRPGRAAEKSESFDRWAVGVDLRGGVRTPLGWSRLYLETTLAENLDRAVFIADPVAGSEARELGYVVTFVQQVTPYGLVGFRTDFYDGNSDFTDSRRGQIVPADQSVRTYSPLVGLVLPSIARLVFQYDIIDDNLARDARGVPSELKNDQWTLRLQVML